MSRRPFFSSFDKGRIHGFRQRGMSLEAIADKFNCDVRAVRKVLAEPVPPSPEAPRARPAARFYSVDWSAL